MSRTQARSDRGWIRLLVPVSVLALAMALIGGTWALWSAGEEFSGGTITTGTMDLTIGDPTWRQATPGVTEPASGTLDQTPEEFLSMPGEVVEIAIPVVAMLTGDNLEGGFAAEMTDQAALAQVADGQIAASFVVRDSSGVQVAPAQGAAELGTVVWVPGLTGTDAGASSEWTVVVQVTVLGDYAWTDQQVRQPVSSWSAGSLRVRLAQVRAGANG